MSDRPIRLILSDMLDATTGIFRFVKGMDEQDYFQDEKTQAAVERYLEIIGEAANKLPDSFYAEHNHVEWHKIVSLRNRIIHAYFDVNDTIVWNIVVNFLPSLKIQLEAMIETL
ncbi:MAG: DUF86 domain-containing protein [Chitinophagaceae bacterium]